MNARSNNVLCLATDAYGGRGGIAQACRDVIDALAQHDAIDRIDVLPRHAPDPPSMLPEKARQHRARSQRLEYAVSAFAAARANPAIVFCNHLFMAPLAALIARRTKAHLVIQLHGIEIWQSPSWLRRRALEAADYVWCVSRDTRGRALAHADILPERAIVINNTVRPQFQPGDRTQARARLGLSHQKILLSVGRLDPGERYKGQDLVIEALPELRRHGLQPLYLIAGEGADRLRLEQLARARGVEAQVRFLGAIDACELPHLYRAADVFVMPSSGEGFGIAFLEAMACGTPAIGLAVAGAKDALADGELGWCVSTAEFSRALVQALAAPARAGLSSDVVARFGREAFRERITQAVAMML